MDGAIDKHQRFEMRKETSDLINALEGVSIGEIITYDQHSGIAHGDVRWRCRGNLDAARKYLQREKRLLFGVVKNIGLKLATDAEAIMESEKGIRTIRRAAKRSIGKAVCVQDFNTLSDDMKTRHNATLSLFGAIGLAVSPGKVKQVQEAVKTANDRLAIGQTLDLFKK